MRLVVYYLSAVFAVYCLWYGFARVGYPNFDAPPQAASCQCSAGTDRPATTPEKTLSNYGKHKVWFLVFWIAIPPAWFWLDYFGLYQYDPVGIGKLDLERFKYGQDVASKIWIALVTALTILYFGKDLHT
jgi:hypothetical protein